MDLLFTELKFCWFKDISIAGAMSDVINCVPEAAFSVFIQQEAVMNTLDLSSDVHG